MPDDTKDPTTLLIEATVRREVQKQLVNGQASVGPEIRADQWDFYITRIEEYPGSGWIFHCYGGMHNATAYIIWRMSRVEQAKLGIKPKIAIL
jgi:hypothetical protein